MSIETGSIQVYEPGIDTNIDPSTKLLLGIASCAEDLSTGRGWPDGVNSLLETLGHITEVSRVWIFQTIELTSEYIIQNYAFEWVSKAEYAPLGMRAFNMFRRPFDSEDYRNLIESRKCGEWQKVLFSKIKPSPMKEDLARQKIKSMLTIPIMVEDQWWGVLGFDDCEREYDWTYREIALLKTATFLISNAIVRDRLGVVRNQFDILQSITESTAWRYSFKNKHFWCTADLINTLPSASQNVHLSTRGVLKVVYKKDRRQFIEAILSFIKKGEGSFRRDIRIYSQFGEVLWVEVIGKLIVDDKGRAEQLAGIAIDIRGRKQREELLHEQATTDHLTGVMNRAMFEKKISSYLELNATKITPFSLLILDIDHFKQVNDTWGHNTGDNVLRDFASVCETNLRNSDLLARVGGEEFVVLLPDSSRETARVIGERIRLSVEKHCFKIGVGRDDVAIKITTSIGCTTYDGLIQTTLEVLFKRADDALYAAKRLGRNMFKDTHDLLPK